MDVDQLLSSNLGGLSLQPNQKKTATQDPPGSTDNGKFDLLPTEITSYILTFLALDDLGRLACVSRLFREQCYSPMLPLHQHLNLQPYWHILDTHSIQGFVKKCCKIQSLNISWCGTHTDMLVSSSLIELVSAPTLTRLEMSSCALTDQAFTQIARRCHNLQYLDISATYQYLSVKSIQMISFLSELTW